jgi:hypothetical protein
LKFRTYYEENCKANGITPIAGTGIDIISKINDGSYKSDNLDDIVL